MGVLWELITFAARSVGAKFQQSVAPVYVALLILLAPIWVNAFVYMVLGRMIWFFVPEQKIWGLRGIKVAKYFVWLDVMFVSLSSLPPLQKCWTDANEIIDLS